MAKIKVTQIKSLIGQSERQRSTMRSLGIRKMHQTVEVEANPQILGMIEKVKHLVRIEQ
ncbi:MAG TPA: 50S ribosomal protein L30 [Tenuifilaceae bacterium]|jgi:large subunit ribosomal protein L30|nr:MAG: 50S ribosomal protein L30 [Bacteroidales bacterium]HOZ14413.1 50S ribosomal protein L30 [Tenuifilaceae bacterium]HPI44362.1 50S ribosomal protein L30 [Tenuifilaceae bacterium]HPN23225.1 50S ribosomal protein L30 [Tenuifilaceae bacterium]HPV57111.1 50S ribosomal protein L30 [Tenuifilaceae bacterium]